jgi:hypothetical protein
MQAATAEAQLAKQHIGTLEAQIERLMTSKADLSDVVSSAALQQAVRGMHSAVDGAVSVRFAPCHLQLALGWLLTSLRQTVFSTMMEALNWSSYMYDWSWRVQRRIWFWP